MTYWIAICYVTVGALHAVALFRRDRAGLDKWEDLPWWFSLLAVVGCVSVWPVVTLMALGEGYYTLYSRSKWAEEKRWEGWPLGDRGAQRYAAHDEMVVLAREQSRQNESQANTIHEANGLINALRKRLREQTSADEFVCDSCWEKLNGQLLYGLIPWRREVLEGTRCAKCKTALESPAINFSEDLMGTLGAVGDVIRNDRETR